MTTLTPEAPATISVKDHPLARELNVIDRCDRCNAQAFVQAILPRQEEMDQEILFCGHHFRKHTAALIAQGLLINDQTHKINEKGGASA